MKCLYFYNLIFLSIVINIGFGIVIPVMPLIIGEGSGTSILGVPFISLVIGRLTSKKVTGILINKGFGKNILSICFLAYSATFLMYSLETSIYLIAFYRFIEGVIEGVVVICLTALAVEATNKDPERGKKMGFFGASFGLGMVLGPVIGSFIFSYYSYRYVFFFASLFGFIGFLISVFLRKHFCISNSADGKTIIKIGGVEELRLLGVYIPSIVRRFTLFSCMLIAPVYVVQSLNGDVKDVGVMFSLSGIISTLLMPFMGVLADKFDPLKISSISMFIMGFCFLLMSMSNEFYVFVFFFCIETIVFTMMLPSGLKQFGDVVDNFGERVSVIGRFSIYTEFSTIFLAIVVSFFIGVESYFSWVFVSVVCMVLSVLYFFSVVSIRKFYK
ncbi:MFS transporter [Pseudoalteromonas sp. S16_S37]|uniref:MFS transporter n=1 Tax=Pseudoalteromonas sp. S16_S37 TaxID=2720228 RepID=UPI00168119A9|nr:MFS transporter [Pseudoalteromonas sp. S16_S37]